MSLLGREIARFSKFWICLANIVFLYQVEIRKVKLYLPYEPDKNKGNVGSQIMETSARFSAKTLSGIVENWN